MLRSPVVVEDNDLFNFYKQVNFFLLHSESVIINQCEIFFFNFCKVWKVFEINAQYVQVHSVE